MNLRNRFQPQLEALEERYAPSNANLESPHANGGQADIGLVLLDPKIHGITDNGFDHGHHGHQYFNIGW